MLGPSARNYIGVVNPFEIYDKKRTAYLYQTLAHLIQFHLINGYQHFIIKYVFEQEEKLQNLVEALASFQQVVYCFWLSCTLAEQRRHSRQRNNEQRDWELGRAVELSTNLNTAHRTEFIGQKRRSRIKT